MNDFTAIILAAGLGVRMGPRGRLMPKGLIPMGGVPLVRQSVESLFHWGASRIAIVTGHLAEQYESEFAGDEVTLIHNPYYATTGSLRTLSLALEHVEGPCVILESDLVYAPQALELLSTGTSTLVTSGATGAGDEVYVWTTGSDNHLDAISKQKSDQARAPFGELVGITALSGGAVALMSEVAAEVLARDPGEHYEHGLVALARKDPIKVVRSDDLPWAEVDDEAMLERAVREVYPRVEAAREARQAVASGAPQRE